MIAIIDYGVGNLFSVEKAVAALGAPVTVTRDEAVIRAAEKVVLPGVGAFGVPSGMTQNLKSFLYS